MRSLAQRRVVVQWFSVTSLQNGSGAKVLKNLRGWDAVMV